MLFLQTIMGLRLNFARKKLTTKLDTVSREKKVVNLDSARTAGILWEFSQKDAFDLLEKELLAHQIKPVGLCYFKSKKAVIPEGINGFSRKQVSWKDAPDLQLVQDFIHEKFDLLIDLTRQNYYPLAYVTALSEAAFKIGSSGFAPNYFDLNIEFATEPEPVQLAEQILYYLKRINKTTIE